MPELRSALFVTDGQTIDHRKAWLLKQAKSRRRIVNMNNDNNKNKYSGLQKKKIVITTETDPKNS